DYVVVPDDHHIVVGGVSYRPVTFYPHTARWRNCNTWILWPITTGLDNVAIPGDHHVVADCDTDRLLPRDHLFRRLVAVTDGEEPCPEPYQQRSCTYHQACRRDLIRVI